ncbi:hypothetical protein [Acinetobacter guillouiae]|uniref:hypothetical protein n=1 Tax=Acinetobacter guillouiae TaxID=106649 RepID=UPI001AE2568A|nr:hypothetical protein [Acinetobacter guillouiae]MBP2543895.1 hypothetical protein [Acinetobacter guillouiae]
MKMHIPILLLLSCMIATPSLYASDLAPMLGSWQCTAQAEIALPINAGKPLKMVETYTVMTTADGISEGDDSTIFYFPLGEKLMPIEVISHSKAQYRLQDDTLKLLVLTWELREGRIAPKERADFITSMLGKNAPAAARSQLGAKIDRMAEDFAETIAKSFQARIGKESSMPFRLTTTGAGKIEKTFGSGANAVTHQCIRLSK